MGLARVAVRFLLPVVALALASCSGSAHHSSEPPPPPPGKPAPNPFQQHVRHRTYVIKLTSGSQTTGQPRSGSAAAALSIEAAHDQVCWKFSLLANVPAPLFAYIHRGAAGTAGPLVITLGGSYQPSGCTTGVAPALLAQIEAHPHGYYLSIHTRPHPAGAVRGQL